MMMIVIMVKECHDEEMLETSDNIDSIIKKQKLNHPMYTHNGKDFFRNLTG